ncbi:MAG: SusC/RagA family TonB-linked outer membrane protein [Bacteroidales bacterium]|nr:SusC/RagA family TonB-linked outer membrane protein [Bacteroidales bacterium]
MEIPVDGQLSVNCELSPDAEYLDDVVVIAYGTQSARTVTAAVSSVKAEALKDAPNVSFDSMLQGQAAGVQVSTPNAGAGSQAKVLIRGVSSISAGTDPLYIVDGVPISTGVVNASYIEANALSDINPADILSIDVLKDAAATALYGSRAASGVIIITTKQGRKGETKVTYDMNIGVTQPTKLYKMMDAETYYTYKNQAVKNAYGTDERVISGGANPYGNKAFNYMTDSAGNIIRTNWNDLVYKNGLVQNHTVAISGGSDKTQYYISANYSNNDGIIIGDSYKRYGIKANVSSQVNSWLKVGLSAQYSRGDTRVIDSSRGGSVFSAAGLPRVAMIMPPILTPYNEDGSYYVMNGGQYIGVGGISISSLSYPNGMAQKESFNAIVTDRVIASGFAQVEVVKNLFLKTQFGADYMVENEETFWSPIYGQGAGNNGYAWRTMDNALSWTWTNTANYNVAFKNNSFDFLLGMEAYYDSYAYDWINASDILNKAYKGFRAGYVTNDAGGSEGAKSMVSYFARVNYDYKSRYMVSANFRRDGLSALGENNKWGNFWGISAAWRISEEPFFAPARNVVDELKLKASYGVVGNSEIGYYNAQTYYGDAVYGGKAALGLANIGDASLAWESSSKYDVGLNASLFNRINVELDWYYTKTNNLVMAVPQGPSTGIGSLVTNTGAMQNTGVEFTIGADVIRTKNFTWNTNFNITTSHNKVLELAEGVTEIYGESDANITMPGYSVGQLYVYPTGGIDPATGRRIFYGSEGEWTTYDPYSRSWYLADGTEFQGNLAQVRAGNTLPTWFGGWTNSFKYKGFDFNFMLQYSGGNWILNAMTATGSDNRWWNNFAEVAEKSWKQPGDKAKYAFPVYGDNVSNGSAYDISDWIEKGDYLRLKSVSFGYTYKTKTKKNLFNSIRAYVQVQNAFVLTAFTGLDPEITSSYTSQAVLSGGYYKNTLPQARTFTLGVQLTF